MTAPTASLPDWLAHRAATTPERLALVANGRTWTFTALDAAAARMARQLATLGAGAGDRVAMLLHNGAHAAILAHAVRRLGAVLVPLNIRLSATELAWQLADASARVVVAEERTVTLLGRAQREIPGLAIARIDDAESLADVAEGDATLRATIARDDALAIIYTSGTTGRPKGAMLTAGNFWWSAVGSALNLGTHTDDRWLATLPLFHVGGLSIVIRATIYGIVAVVHDGFDAEAVNRAIDDERVTMISVVAVTLQRMLDAHGDRAYPPSLRCVLLGGGPAPRPLLERCAVLGVPVVQTYGLTETTSQLATLAPEEALPRLGSAGRPLYPNALRIAREDGSEAAPDEAGEIQARGPVVMAGYVNQPEATARAIVDGWLRTGDVGRVDADGYLYVLDRRDDLIITGGENVYPAEVEAALLAHPSVAEVGVIGMSDDEWGQRVVAVVRLTSTPVAPDAADALREHCRERLAAYKTPREIHVMAEPLPRTASGKLRRGALREHFEAERARMVSTSNDTADQ